MASRLIVFSGLPGAGKSSIACSLACELGAVWLRIDSIEQAIRQSGVLTGNIDDVGYRAAYAMAEDNLRIGLTVIADSVNPCIVTRNAWRDVGLRAGASVVEVEIICSEKQGHRRRVQTRAAEAPGLGYPDWEAAIGRDYQPWDRDRIMIDTAGRSIAESVSLVRHQLSNR